MFWLDTRVRSGPARVCSLGTGPTHFRSGSRRRPDYLLRIEKLALLMSSTTTPDASVLRTFILAEVVCCLGTRQRKLFADADRFDASAVQVEPPFEDQYTSYRIGLPPLADQEILQFVLNRNDSPPFGLRTVTAGGLAGAI